MRSRGSLDNRNNLCYAVLVPIISKTLRTLRRIPMAGSLILFVFFIIIYILISDIITIFFRLTGLTEEKARFQVISLLTNSGFTTRESESVVSSKVRRRLARATMLFGYAFTVTIVSTTVNFFMTLGKSELNSLQQIMQKLLI